MSRQELFEALYRADLDVDVIQDFHGSIWLKFTFDEDDEEEDL